jgi:uncharacterized protein (TIGR03437 family)
MTARRSRGILGVAGLCAAASFLSAQTGTPLQIVTSSLPPASLGVAYNQQLVTSGGLCSSKGTPSSTIDSGALPAGISVTSPASTEQWYLQGTPFVGGTFTFTVHVRWTFNRVGPVGTNCVDDAVKTLTLTVQGSGGNPPPNPGSNPVLSADRTQVAVTYHLGTFPPASDIVNVSAAAGVAAPIVVQAVTDSGVPWMSVSAQPAVTPAALTISYFIGGLAAGTYTGRVTVTSGTTVLPIPVTLVVVADPNVQLQVTPSSLAFSAALGGPDPPGQSLQVTVTGLNRLFQVAVLSAPPNGKWLTVAPSAALTPQSLTVTVAAKDLAAGVYAGTLQLTVEGIPTASVTIPVTYTLQVKPAISPGGVVDAAGGGKAIAPGTWVSIFGTLFSSTTRAWRAADFQNGVLPTALDGVSVTIDGKPAAVAFISPTQINVLAPDDSSTGLGPVQVKSALGVTDSAYVLQQTAAPALFEFPGAKYAAATHADGSYLAGPTLVQQGIPGTPAKVGETIVLYGTGFGATQPAISATAPVPAALPLARLQDLSVRIGGLDAAVVYAGLISPGVYQFNVVVPQVAAGDQSVVAELHGLLSQSNLLLTVQP